MVAKNNNIFSFIAPEYFPHKRGRVWYVLMIAFLGLLVTYGVMSDAWTFSLALLVFAGVYALLRMKEPKQHQVTITDSGITIGPYTLLHENLKGFSIQPDFLSRKRIVLIPKKRFQGEISIPLEDGQVEDVREHFLLFLEEITNHPQKVSDVLVQLLKL